MSRFWRILPVAAVLLLSAACTVPRYRERLDSEGFRQLLATVARAWTAGNARLAADCFTEDAIYSSPPSARVHRGRAALFEFFGGEKGRPKPMSMQWRHIAFDEGSQVGMGEYTFTYEIRTHGVVVVRVDRGKIANWRGTRARIAARLGRVCRRESVLAAIV